MNAIRSIVDAARASTRELTSLLRREQGSLVDFLLALQPFDDRRLWAELGYASLFDFLHRELNLSKSAAYYRNAAVALVRKYPEVAKALADGKLCLSTVGEVGKVLEPENVGAVLPRFFHLSAREARELVAELSPHPTPPMREVVTIVRTVPAGASNPAPAIPLLDRAGWGVLTSGNGSVAAQVAPREAVRNVSETRPAVLTHAVEPLSSDLRRVHFTVSKAWMSKLQAAKEALSHSIPHGDAEAVPGARVGSFAGA